MKAARTLVGRAFALAGTALAVGAYTISRLLGHRHISTTSRYLHLISPQFLPSKDIHLLEICWPACRACKPCASTPPSRMATLSDPLRRFGPSYLANYTLSSKVARFSRA